LEDLTPQSRVEKRRLAEIGRRRHVTFVEAEPLISREELTATLFVIATSARVREIRVWLIEESDGETSEDDS
jgi:hypothetical protein